uniref:Uncharacterized protein n=1 Tax=Arundo donax TaxID=35708 RepID=A0A0A9I280_ARUDO
MASLRCSKNGQSLAHSRFLSLFLCIRSCSP